MNEHVRRFWESEPLDRQPHFANYVAEREHEELYQGLGETALVIDARIYAELMVTWSKQDSATISVAEPKPPNS